MTTTHVPVLAGELIDLLDPQPGEIAVDCTFGGGGHARLVAERLGPAGELIAIDRDPAAEERFAELAADVACRTRFIRAPFADALQELRDEGVRADLVYLDLGMSSMQVDTRERGFSYAYDAPLDMRMDPDDELTAADVVNTWDERRLATLLRDYGEERYARPIARALVRARAAAPMQTTNELVEVVTAAVPVPARFASGHPAKRVFQAIRIAVNDELGQLDAALPAGLGPAARTWPVCRDFLPFAGRPPREALPGRQGAGLHLPAGLPGVRLRSRPGGRAAHAPRRGAHARRGRRQPPRAVRPDARSTEARGDPSMTPPATIAARHPTRTVRRGPAAPRPPRRISGPSRPKRDPRASATAATAVARPPFAMRLGTRAMRVGDAPRARPPRPRARRGSRSWRSGSSGSSSCRSRCSSSTPASAGR